MIAVHAASRLKANADEHMARRFIEEVAEIDPGPLQDSIPSNIRFEIRPDQYSAAKRALTERYGKGTQAGPGVTAGIFTWKLTPNRGIVLSDAKYGGGTRNIGYSIALFDLDHKETPQQMLRRILGDPKPIAKR